MLARNLFKPLVLEIFYSIEIYYPSLLILSIDEPFTKEHPPMVFRAGVSLGSLPFIRSDIPRAVRYSAQRVIFSKERISGA